MKDNIKEKQMEILLYEFQLLAKTILKQLKNVSKLLHDGADEAVFEELEGNEIIIDRLEVKIREEVIFAIFKFNPIAADLRLIISYQDITTNLERIGDMILNVAHLLKITPLTQTEMTEVREMLILMMEAAFDMTENSIYAFSNADTKIAYEIIKKDDKVDALFHKIALFLQEKYAQKQVSKQDVIQIINVSMISNNFERIGDSATNIAESAVFITEGKDIRHEEE